MKPFLWLLAVALHLSACSGAPSSPAPNAASNTRTTADLTSPSTPLNSDGLQAPTQPKLDIEASLHTLTLSWQMDSHERSANLYAYNNSTREETLIQGNISASTASISIDSNTPRRAWHAEQFRVELCDSTDCVSSDRVSLNTLAAATTQSIRPSVFIEGERFAEYIAANHDASVVIATLPVQGAIQVFFHIERQWIETPPIRLNNMASMSIKSIASSTSGDTLAALAAGFESPSTIRIIERLGEAWLPTATLPVPATATLDTNSQITLSANGDALLLHSASSVLLYRRNQNNWSIETPIPISPDATLKAVAVNSSFSTIHVVTSRDEQLWLSSYLSDIHDQPLTGNQEPAGDRLETNENEPLNESAPTWRRVGHTLIQGLAIHDEIQLHTNIDASTITVAGWDNSIVEQRSPVMWRFSTTENSANPESGDAQIMDSLRSPPTTDARALLRFSASDVLDTVALGWQSSPGGAAEVTTYTYKENQRQWLSALELPHEMTRLAKQAFAQTVLLSSDGETLLVTTPSNGASNPSNRVGELRIFH